MKAKKIFDEYGFLIPLHAFDGVLQKLTYDITLKMLTAQAKQENSLQEKWDQILRSSSGLRTLCTKLSNKKRKELAIKGIPLFYRGPVWQQLLGSDRLRLQHQGLYQYLQQFSSPSETQIQLDIVRTFTSHPGFKLGILTKPLFRILKAFALVYPDVGYVQGLNYIAAVFLFHMNEV